MIIRLPTDDLEVIENFTKKFRESEEVIISDFIKILIKDKEGYWKELEGGG